MLGSQYPASGKPTPDFRPGDPADPFRFSIGRRAGLPTFRHREAAPVLSEIPRGVEIPRADLDPRRYVSFDHASGTTYNPPEVVALVAEHPGSDHSAPGGPVPDAGKPPPPPPPPPPADDQGAAEAAYNRAVTRLYRDAGSGGEWGYRGRVRVYRPLPVPRPGWRNVTFLDAEERADGPALFTIVGKAFIPTRYQYFPVALVVAGWHYALELQDSRPVYVRVVPHSAEQWEPAPRAEGLRATASDVPQAVAKPAAEATPDELFRRAGRVRCPLAQLRLDTQTGPPLVECHSSCAPSPGWLPGMSHLRGCCLTGRHRGCGYFPDELRG